MAETRTFTVRGEKVELTKKDLQTMLKEFDKQKFRFTVSENNETLFINNECIDHSNLPTDSLIIRMNMFWTEISEKLGIPTLSLEEKLDGDVAGYYFDLDWDYGNLKIIPSMSTRVRSVSLQTKIWNKDNFYKIKEIICENEVFIQWFDNKFNKIGDK